MLLDTQLKNFIDQPTNPDYNFELAVQYDEIGQTTSAYSYFLRTAELSNDENLVYESLIKAGQCLAKQGQHRKSEKGMYLHALSLQPDRPETYYILSQFYEIEKEWIDVYAMASVGLTKHSNTLTRANINYPGQYGLIFQKAVSAWWIGKHDESRELFELLAKDYEYQMSDFFKQLVHNNIVFLRSDRYPFAPYTSLVYSKLKFKFQGSIDIKQNYSQAYQDMFVLSMLNGKENGTYLEIGSSDPFSGNNTALLETQFNWKGISLDISEKDVNNFRNSRRNPVYLQDAVTTNYNLLLNENDMPTDMDYLQIDCDPAEITYEILTKIPFDTHRFAVITFEHDHYTNKASNIKTKSREFLKSKGYELVISNVAPNDTDDFEDWYVHPQLVQRSIINILKNTNDSIKGISKQMLYN